MTDLATIYVNTYNAGLRNPEAAARIARRRPEPPDMMGYGFLAFLLGTLF